MEKTASTILADHRKRLVQHLEDTKRQIQFHDDQKEALLQDAAETEAIIQQFDAALTAVADSGGEPEGRDVRTVQGIRHHLDAVGHEIGSGGRLTIIAAGGRELAVYEAGFWQAVGVGARL